MIQASRAWARRVAPYPVRVAVARLRHLPARLLQWPATARRRDPELDAPFVLARRVSPLVRTVAAGAPAWPSAEEAANVRAAAARVDGLVIAPHQVMSFLWTVGWPARWRGFRPGLELHDARPTLAIGGGTCKVSNLVYQLALAGGMRVIERHRHALDLFPDRDRTAPFALGATVAYNHADLRFANPLAAPVTLRLTVRDGELVGELRTARDPGWRVEVVEHDHRFVREPDGWWRENRIRRRIVRVDGTLLCDQEIAHNRARVMYDPALVLPAPTEATCSAA
ncbi:MAG: VanW family protein [Kofleriaceae bacterium]|nr:VanW family protein [Myxococcales bacterium]MCB9561964.1 VanW family protein [Kofleriaceae bacterium]MCB9573133.1 VanW family protein [Kofleriaceae bacterium]